MTGLAAALRRITGSRAFQRTVLALILVNATVIGLETSAGLMARFGGALIALHVGLQILFVLEIAARIGAHGPRPLEFFKDGWNLFDFSVVAVSLLPAAGSFATVVRLARILRVARLASALPDLRLIIGTMLRSIPSMGHVLALLALLLYVYGVLGVHLFGEDAPEQWGSLAVAMQSLFQILTLEGWVEIQDAVLPAHSWAWAYFASFIVFAVFVVINLFIAVVINNLETTRNEEARRRSSAGDADVLEQLEDLRARFDALDKTLRSVVLSGDRRREPPEKPVSLRPAV
jgi:voltage-gated sodium channel